MAGFQSPISIYQALKSIENKEYLLPAFQREYVWTTEQIERLFDSLMQGGIYKNQVQQNKKNFIV